MNTTELLVSELRSQRRHVLQTLSDLTEEQLATPVLPTTWAPIAAAHHLALDVERWWFRAIVAGEPEAWAYFDDNPGGAWTVPAGTDVLGLYRTECAAADAIIARSDLSALPATWPDFLGQPQTVHEIILHVVTETAAHAGQLDIVRETIDGRKWLVLD